jgi:hypothetical protein
VKNRICFLTITLILGMAAAASSAFSQEDKSCEVLLKQLTQNKKTKTLPYVCPKQLGAQLQRVLSNIKDSTRNGYQFDKAVLHIETGSTTELDLGLNLVVFTVTYKRKKGLTQSMDAVFSHEDKKELSQYLSTLQSLSIVEVDPAAKSKQKNAEDKLKDALNEAMDIASQVTVLPNTTVVAKVQFSVSNEVDAGVSFVIYGPAKGSAGLDFTKTSVNSIEVTLKKAKT